MIGRQNTKDKALGSYCREQWQESTGHYLSAASSGAASSSQAYQRPEAEDCEVPDGSSPCSTDAPPVPAA